jgi:hypothetical protein
MFGSRSLICSYQLSEKALEIQVTADAGEDVEKERNKVFNISYSKKTRT